MLQRDYILRTIEQAGGAIRRLRDRILGREADGAEVREELGRVLDGYGFDLDFVRAASGAAFYGLDEADDRIREVTTRLEALSGPRRSGRADTQAAPERETP